MKTSTKAIITMLIILFYMAADNIIMLLGVISAILIPLLWIAFLLDQDDKK